MRQIRVLQVLLVVVSLGQAAIIGWWWELGLPVWGPGIVTLALAATIGWNGRQFWKLQGEARAQRAWMHRTDEAIRDWLDESERERR